MTDAPDLDHLEALRAAAAIEGRLSARTTGRAGGDHWYLCDDNESVAHITANDGEDEELRQPRAEYITALHNADLVAALREAEAKLAAIHNLAQLWTAGDNVDDPHTRVTNRAYAGVPLDVLHREGEPT